MKIDVNAYLGHFAFRQLRHNTGESLLKLMDQKGIDKAVVSSASAITYRNAQSGNDEVAAEVKGHRDRLLPFAVINPNYAGWQDDLKICHEEHGMQGLRLYPKWHNYSLSSKTCHELIDAAASRGMLVSIPFRVEDNRQRSWLVDVPDLTIPEVVALVKSFPKARFILLNGLGFVNSLLGRGDSGLPSNYFLEISRLSAELANEMGSLIESLGADRLLFGTGMPFNYVDPALTKIEVLKATKEDKEKIAWRNAAKLLGEGH